MPCFDIMRFLALQGLSMNLTLFFLMASGGMPFFVCRYRFMVTDRAIFALSCILNLTGLLLVACNSEGGHREMAAFFYDGWHFGCSVTVLW